MWSRVTLALATAAAALVVAATGQSTAAAAACASPPPPSRVGAVPVALPTSPLAADTSIHWTRVQRRVTYGATARLEGQVVTSEGALGDARVDLYRRTASARDWVHVASATTDPDTGLFEFGCLRPARTTRYRAVHEATLTHGHAQDERRVGVSRRMPDEMRQVGPNRFVFEGAVLPRYDGAVTLQRRSCPRCGWVDASRRRTGPGSTWRFGISVDGTPGEVAFRAYIPADQRFARSVSDRTWRVRTR